MRFVTYFLILLVLGVSMGLLMRLGLTEFDAMIVVIAVCVTLMAGLLIGGLYTPETQRGVRGALARRARRVLTGTTALDWLAAVGITAGLPLINHAPGVDSTAVVGLGWMLNWFVVFPKAKGTAAQRDTAAGM